MEAQNLASKAPFHAATTARAKITCIGARDVAQRCEHAHAAPSRGSPNSRVCVFHERGSLAPGLASSSAFGRLPPPALPRAPGLPLPWRQGVSTCHPRTSRLSTAEAADSDRCLPSGNDPRASPRTPNPQPASRLATSSRSPTARRWKGAAPTGSGLAAQDRSSVPLR